MCVCVVVAAAEIRTQRFLWFVYAGGGGEGEYFPLSHRVSLKCFVKGSQTQGGLRDAHRGRLGLRSFFGSSFVHYVSGRIVSVAQNRGGVVTGVLWSAVGKEE